MISSIINKEFLSSSDNINIVWTQCDNLLFDKFIKSIFPESNFIEPTQTYYANNDISLIICNNRITSLNKCLQLAKFYLCAILIIDHDHKSNYINDNNIEFDIDPVYSVALSKDIYVSWNRIQNNVLSYDIYDAKNVESWKNLIFQLCKSNLIVK